VVQAERVAKTFASSLHEGSAATFYFMLPHYVEGQTQFGLLRPDLTPRPSYVALAAVGRILADARPRGRLRGVPDTVRGFLFRARPQGQETNVLVAWTTKGEAMLPLNEPASAVFDHLGRAQTSGDSLSLASAPIFAVLPDDALRERQLNPPPASPELAPGAPSPVVIQAIWPEKSIVLSRSAYRLSSEGSQQIPLFVYNFSEAPVAGQLHVSVPAGWQADPLAKLEIAPHSRAELSLGLDCRKGEPRAVETVVIEGNFGPDGEPVLSMQVMPEPSALGRQPGTPLLGANEPRCWLSTVSGDGACKILPESGLVAIAAQPQGADKWVYPQMKLPATQRPPPGTQALCFTLVSQEGEGAFRVLFEEDNGSTYVAEILTQPKPRQTLEAIALLEDASFGAGWSKPDPNGKFDPERIVSLKIGGNTQAATLKFAFKDLRWVGGKGTN